jgi:hypothetical protein
MNGLAAALQFFDAGARVRSGGFLIKYEMFRRETLSVS